MSGRPQAAGADGVVVGGGVVGAAVAWFLAREGVAATPFERSDIAGEASGVPRACCGSPNQNVRRNSRAAAREPELTSA